jgi:hypothetical protein
MSDTPRTDACEKIATRRHGYYDRFAIARELESELAEARELLRQCLKVMPCGYIPTHTIENLPKMISDLATELAEEITQRETLEGMYHKVISACLKCDPIAACQREDGELEPPWEVIDRVMSQRDRLERELATALRDRDNALSDWTQSDTDSIRALHERNEARNQRNTLAGALQRVDECLSNAEDVMHGAGSDDVSKARRVISDTLAAVKGGTP